MIAPGGDRRLREQERRKPPVEARRPRHPAAWIQAEALAALPELRAAFDTARDAGRTQHTAAARSELEAAERLAATPPTWSDIDSLQG